APCALRRRGRAPVRRAPGREPARAGPAAPQPRAADARGRALRREGLPALRRAGDITSLWAQPTKACSSATRPSTGRSAARVLAAALAHERVEIQVPRPFLAVERAARAAAVAIADLVARRDPRGHDHAR